MTKFETWLIENGWLKFRFDCKLKKLIPITDGEHFISTMSNLDYRYVRESDNSMFIFGLHEHKKPPTLIYPRPKFKVNGIWIYPMPDDVMNRLLSKHSPEEIVNIIHKKITILE